ncbi:MAG TPA: helix-hairpin-helix domain-containing protein [Candidatus Limnocylindria bacterium]|nr:helix-hairpin-helix domain-containing protein [Candidatus Limnocylindria bacterium]
MSRSDRIVLATAGAAVVLAAVAVSVLFLPPEAEADGGVAAALVVESFAAADAQPSASAGGGPIVVDVEGGVRAPGVRELPAGSRVADAIAAAGGYADDADLPATAATINLAKPLTDGEQVIVPRIGDGAQAVASVPAGGGGSAGGGLVNVNTATPEELEALPGIGAVTVQKIVAARQERPFASLEEMVERGVIHNGQLEDIRELATAG